MIQSVKHVYIRCRKWKKQQRKLVRKLEKKKFAWQVKSGKRLLANLLGNKRSVRLLMRFLKITGVGEREEAREKEL